MNNIKMHYESDSEDEIFFGEVTSLERKKARLLQNRRTEVFKSPLLPQQQHSSMAPSENVPKTYSKVTEAKRQQVIKQRPPPLPPFTQLYCSKDGQPLNSPFHLLTKCQTKTHHSPYRSTQSILPLPSPHMHSMPPTSCHLLSVPSQHQQHRRTGLSPGLSPSFWNYDTYAKQDPFDKLQSDGYVNNEGNVTPINYIVNTSCSSIEDVVSPAGLLFSRSPIILVDLHNEPKNKKKKEKIVISETSSSEKSTGCFTPSEVSKAFSQMSLDGIRKTPDLFFTSAWITRRNNYRKFDFTKDLESSLNEDTNLVGKRKLHRSSSVPEIHIIHPEESDNSFMSQNSLNISSNSNVSLGLRNLNQELDNTSPKWLLTIASALNQSLSFSDADNSTYAQSPLSELAKTFDTVSTLTPTFSKYISYNKKPLSTTFRGIINKS